MKAARHDLRWQVERFLTALFLPDELIELRFIESWISGGKKRSRVVRRAEWLRRREFVSRHCEINELARQAWANVYFGVCPRPTKGDSRDEDIQTVRCLWADVDDVTAAEAFERWKTAEVPSPSIVVSSGSGIHGYWLLDRDIRSREQRSWVTAMLPYFYRSFGGDHVQNLSRILRVPGTLNFKDARNGRPSRPCVLLLCEPEHRYPLEAFAHWFALATEDRRQARTSIIHTAPRSTPRRTSGREADVAEIVRQLDRPSRDRSRRDFAVVCDLLRLGLTRKEIWALVAGSSKFESNGRPYFDLTIANAERNVLLDSASAGRPEAPG